MGYRGIAYLTVYNAEMQELILINALYRDEVNLYGSGTEVRVCIYQLVLVHGDLCCQDLDRNLSI